MEDKLQEIFDAHARGEHFSWSNCPLCWAQRQIREMLSAPMISSIVLVTLLSCGVVEAETGDTDCFRKGSDGTGYDICRMPDMRKILKDPNDWIWIDKGNGMIATCNDTLTQCWTPCEVKMKEAMKAVDQYLPYREFFTSKNATMEYCDDVCMAERALDAAKKQAAAMAKWRAVYKECVQ